MNENEEHPYETMVFEFLDELRESGETNMFGARTYILEQFPELTKHEASDLLQKWMQTFSERHPE